MTAESTPTAAAASRPGQPCEITRHRHATPRHGTAYLACGAADAPLIIFVHGWPELAHSWRHQLPACAALGFRAIAPDMRGYGGSTVHPGLGDYSLEAITADMLELLAALGREDAIWVGHDWGSPVVWSLAAHHPARCRAVASLCVPYLPNGDSAANYIDRSIYPVEQYPIGQWDYFLYYQEHFDQAVAELDADVSATLRCLFRRGDPAGAGKPARTASVRARGGWWSGAPRAPDMPLDQAILSEHDLGIYVEALTRNGFRGPCAWYLNVRANAQYAKTAVQGGRLEMPVLFLHATYDYTCQTVTGRAAEPMRQACARLTEQVVDTGHWMAQENPSAVNAALAEWISSQTPPPA